MHLLLYTGILGVNETAANQATRLKWVLENCLDLKSFHEVAWANQSDNASKAVNVAKALELAELRCFCHMVVLGLAHLLFPKRHQAGDKVWFESRQDTVMEIYELCE